MKSRINKSNYGPPITNGGDTESLKPNAVRTKEELALEEENGSLRIVIRWVVIYCIVAVIAGWVASSLNDIRWFELTNALAAIGSAIYFGNMLAKHKLHRSALWAVVLCSGLLAAIYHHIVLTNPFGNHDFTKVFENTGELGKNVLEVIFITILADFLIRTLSEIRGVTKDTTQAAESAKESVEGYKQIVKETGSTAENLRKVTYDAKESVRILKDYTLMSKAINNIEESILQKKISEGFGNLADVVNKILEPYKSEDVPNREKQMMATLLGTYINEEVVDIGNAKVATNFGVYASLVGGMIDLTIPNKEKPDFDLDDDEKLVIFTIWDKDPKRWYNYNKLTISNPPEKQSTLYYVHPKFEKYKSDVEKFVKKAKSMCANGKKEKIDFIRYIITSTHGNYFSNYGIKNYNPACSNIKDLIFVPNEELNPRPLSREEYEPVVKSINALADKYSAGEIFSEFFLNNIDEKNLYLYLSPKNFEALKGKDGKLENINGTFQKSGEHFINTYHTNKDNAIIIELKDDYLSSYLNDDLSKDFTLFGTQKMNGDLDPKWLFCIGADSDVNRGVLELDFCNNYISREKFNKYQNIYKSFSSADKDVVSRKQKLIDIVSK